MSFPRYPKYKDSGVEWLGEVPEAWRVARLKHLLARNDGGVWGDDPTGEGDTIVLRSTEQTVDGHWQIDDPARRALSNADIAAALLEEGDLLLTKSSGSSLHIGKTSLVDSNVASLRCCYSNFMQRLRVNTSFLPALAWYFLNNRVARLQFDVLSNSTTGLANLNGTMIGDVVVPVPTLPEQAAIAAFLDRETAKIDALIAEQQRLIGLLQDKRQAVISHAVTKGLNPDAPMKDSGVEWLGEVPEHWEVGSLKRFWATTDCKHITAEFVDEGYPLASIREVQSRWVDLSTAKQTTEHFYLQLIEGGRKPIEGDLIFSRNATVGEVAQVPANPPAFAMGQDVCLLRRHRSGYSADYLHAVLRSPVVVEQITHLMIGSTFKRINVEEIRGLMIPMPPSAEQSDIAGRITSLAGEIDCLAVEAVRTVALLQERRSALISAAVTGQIDVRGLAGSEAA
jgi:type I restriction enzyme S subunit